MQPKSNTDEIPLEKLLNSANVVAWLNLRTVVIRRIYRFYITGDESADWRRQVDVHRRSATVFTSEPLFRRLWRSRLGGLRRFDGDVVINVVDVGIEAGVERRVVVVVEVGDVVGDEIERRSEQNSTKKLKEKSILSNLILPFCTAKLSLRG